MGFVSKVSDKEVCLAYKNSCEMNHEKWPYEILAEKFGLPEKVCYRACQRAETRGYIDCGISLRSGWLTESGEKLLKE